MSVTDAAFLAVSVAIGCTVAIVGALERLTATVRRLADGCTCPMRGRPSSTCPRHKPHGPYDEAF